MSDPTAPSPAPPSPGKSRKRRNWKQRLRIAAIVLIVGGVLVRVALSFLLPTVVRKVANAYDLDCTYDRMSLSLLSGNAHIWNLTLRPKSGGDSIVNADYVQGLLSTTNLFRGRLVVYRAEVDGVETLIDREPDGSVPLLARFLSTPADAPIEAAPPPPPPPPPPAATGAAQPVNLQAPLRLDALRVSHVKTTFRDRSVNPTFETTVRTTLRVSDVGSSSAPAKFELQIDAAPVLDTLIVNGQLRNTPNSIDASVSLLLRGLHPKPAAAYLLPLGLNPIADDITVKAQATLTANLVPNTTDVTGQLAISNISATADTNEWASLGSLTLDATKLNASAIELGRLVIERGRASARRSAEWRVQIAGFELVPVTAVASAATQPTTPTTPTAALVASAATPFRASLDELRLADLQATFDDRAVESGGPLVARLDEMTVKDIVFDAANPQATLTIAGAASLPGVVESVRWDGAAKPFASTRHATMKVTADGIRPDALRPYLQAMGLESYLDAASFTANLDASSTAAPDGTNVASANLSNIRLTDRSATLLDLTSASVTNASISSSDGAMRVEAIDLAGPTFNLRRDVDGSLAAFGLRTVSRMVAQATTAPAADVRAATQPALRQRPATLVTAIALPRVQVDRFTWKDIRLNIDDRQNAAAPVAVSGDVGVEAYDLVFDPAATQPPAKPGRFGAWLAAPNLATALAVNGTVQGTPDGAKVSSEISGTGLTGAAIAPYLKPLGIELTLKNGTARAKAGATIAMSEDRIRVDVDLSDVTYADGTSELAGVDALRIVGATLGTDGVNIEGVQVTKPRASVTRNADGTLETFGVRMVTPPPSTQPDTDQPIAPASPAPLRLAAAPMAAVLKQFRMEDGALTIVDRAVNPELRTTLRGSVSLDNASLAATDAPATLNVSGALDGIVDRATVTGTLALAPDAPAAKLIITADNIRGGPLGSYLPPGTTSTLRDGRFTMALDAAISNHAAGGLAGHLAVRDLMLQDRTGGATLAKVGAFTVRAARIDPVDGATLAIDELSSAGVELDVTQRPDGSIETLGFALAAASPPPTEPAVITAAVPVNPAPVASGAAEPGIAMMQPTADLNALVADARRALPLLTVGKVDLNLDRLRLNGLASASGKPVEVARVRLYNTGPMELAGENAEQRPPLKLQVDGAIVPVVKRFAIAIESTPFAAEPAIAIDVKGTGINGQGLMDVVPELANTIDGAGLTDGTFATRLTASLSYGRRGPRDLDLARGFTATFGVKPLEFRGQPDGPVLAGLEEIRGDDIKVQPRSGNVTVKSVELIKPIGRFMRDAAGLHALGMVIPLTSAAPSTQPAQVAEGAPASSDTPATPQQAAPARAQRPTNEIRVDRFAVSGIDVVFEDRTSQPSTVVPLRTLDLEVRDLSNQMLWTGRPMQFDLLCTADRVPLPPRKGSTATTQDADGMELRELFSQITASGRVGLKQTETGAILTGWAKTSVNGLELLGVRGLAEPYKIEIGGGVFDDTNDIRFKDDGSIETRNRVVFTNLSLTEPADGPIRRTLKLPTPIDVAINAVTDADGSITMNLPVAVESGAVEADKLVAPVIGAMTKVLTTAIASAPVKTIEGVGGMLGLGNKDGPPPEPPIELSFLPGVATLEPAQARQLALLAERLRREKDLELQLRHEMSPADIARAQRRANPPAADVRVLADRLRRDRSALLAERATLAAEARTQFAAQSQAADGSVSALRAVDRQLSQIDSSLEQLYDLLRPGAAGQSDRRTRAAGLGVARERFDLVQAAFVDAGVPGAADRVRRTNPQFEPVDTPAGGRVVITVIRRKQ